MPIPAYRAKQSTDTAGNGTLVLNAAATNARSFAAAYGTSARRVMYCISWATGFEIGLGDFDGGTPGSLTRATVLASSNAGALVALPAGTKDVFAVFDPGAREVVAIAGTSTLALADLGNVINFSGTSAATLNLPAVTSVPIGAGFQVWNTGTAALTIDPNGADTVNGAATLVLQSSAFAEVRRLTTGWMASVPALPSTGGAISGPLLAPAGTAAAPAYSFSGDTDTGIFQSVPNVMDISVGGNRLFQINNSGGNSFAVLDNVPGQPFTTLYFRALDASASNSRTGTIQALNESSVPVLSLDMVINTDGGSNLSINATPSGARNTDRRVNRMTVPGSGAISLTGDADVSGNLRFNSGYGSAAIAYGVRAWVNFNGTGTVAIRGSGGLTSITDNGTGDYTLNFNFTMPDVNYCVVGVGASSGPDMLPLGIKGDVPPTTTNVRVWVKSVGVAAGAFDPLYASIAIIR